MTNRTLLCIVVSVLLCSQCAPCRFVYKYARPAFMEENEMDSIFQIGIQKYKRLMAVPYGLDTNKIEIFIKILQSEKDLTFLVSSFSKNVPEIKKFARRTRRFVKVYDKYIPLIFYQDDQIVSPNNKLSNYMIWIRGYMIRVNGFFEIITEGPLI